MTTTEGKSKYYSLKETTKILQIPLESLKYWLIRYDIFFSTKAEKIFIQEIFISQKDLDILRQIKELTEQHLEEDAVENYLRNFFQKKPKETIFEPLDERDPNPHPPKIKHPVPEAHPAPIEDLTVQTDTNDTDTEYTINIDLDTDDEYNERGI